MTAGPVLIRAADPHGDHAALVVQFLGLNRHEAEITGDRRTDIAGAEASLAAAWTAIAEYDGRALVAEIAGAVVGHGFMLFRDDPAFVVPELRAHAYVSELFVRPEARGRGVATALMAELERIAAARKVARIMLSVVAGNAVAEGLYQRLGYAPYLLTMTKPVQPTD